MPVTGKSKPRRLKLRNIFLGVGALVLLLPLAGVWFFRIYENELVKQTELELIAQAALIGAMYKNEWSLLAGQRIELRSRLESKPRVLGEAEDDFTPMQTHLNLTKTAIKPKPEEAQPTDRVADPLALAAGSRMTPVLLDAQRTTLSGVRLLDSQGVVVGGRAEIGKSYAHMEEVRIALSGRYASSLRERTIRRPTRALASISRGTGVRVFAAYPIVGSERLLGVVLLSRTPQSILEHLYEQKEKVFLLAAFVVIVTGALLLFVSYTIARPVHALIAQTRRFAGGDKEALEPLTKPVTDEFALLSENFARMGRSLEQRSDYIRTFATQVSHEFKTPLAAIQGAIELLEEHAENMPKERRQKFLRNIRLDTERLERLMDRLLELARADVTDPRTSATDLLGLIEGFQQRYRDDGLSIRFEPRATPVNVGLAKEVAEAALNNLLDNSRQHGASEVMIALRNTDDGRRWLVDVSDNGRGISAGNADKIFTPFFTTQRDAGGTGLGLSIVRSLLRAHGGDVELVPAESGACFRLALPAA